MRKTKRTRTRMKRNNATATTTITVEDATEIGHGNENTGGSGRFLNTLISLCAAIDGRHANDPGPGLPSTPSAPTSSTPASPVARRSGRSSGPRSKFCGRLI